MATARNMTGAARNAASSEAVAPLHQDHLPESLHTLLGQQIDQLSHRGKMLLAIPNGDFLIAFSDRHPEKTAVIHQIRADFKSKPFPLTPELST